MFHFWVQMSISVACHINCVPRTSRAIQMPVTSASEDLCRTRWVKNQVMTSKTIESYMHFCKNFALNPANIAESFIYSIIASLSFVRHEDVFGAVLSTGVFIDCSRLDRQSASVYGKCADCVYAIQFMHVDEDALRLQETHIRQHVPTLHATQNALGTAGMRLHLEDQVKLYLINNLRGVATTQACEQFSSQLFDCGVSSKIYKFTSALNDCKFNVEEYSKDIAWLHKFIHMGPDFEKEVQHFVRHKESLQHLLKTRVMSTTRGRIRLRDRVKKMATEHADRVVGNAVVSQQATDSFAAWSLRVRFSNSTNRRLRMASYFLMAQSTFDPAAYIHQTLAVDTAQLVVKNLIAAPELEIINLVIDGIGFHTEPFPQLVAFKNQCFKGFAYRVVSRMSWPQYMQLYCAAYQAADIWRDCWVAVIGTISYQIIKDVELFVHTTPINHACLVQCIIGV
jgi:hypothetical protein